MVESRNVCCPYCDETFETGVDASGGNQEYTEDCQVCCDVPGRTSAARGGTPGAARPIVFRLATDAAGHLLEIETRREDD